MVRVHQQRQSKPLKQKIMNSFFQNEEVANLAKQLVVGSAIAMAFLLVVYMGALLAHIVSGCY